MAKPPRRKRINLDYECDAFGCRPRKLETIRAKSAQPKKGQVNPPMVPRYEEEAEYIDTSKAGTIPETEVGLDIGVIEGGQPERKLFSGNYQEAQAKDALKSAAKETPQFTAEGFKAFQEASRRSLLKGGADTRTISPTARPGQPLSITGEPITKIKEQQLKQLLGRDYDIAKDRKVQSKTRYRIDPVTGERKPVTLTTFDGATRSKTNLLTGRTEIIDLTTGETKYTQTPDTKVTKRSTVKVPFDSTSVVDSEEEMAAPTKEALKAAAKGSSGESKRARARRRSRRKYAAGSMGGRQ